MKQAAKACIALGTSLLLAAWLAACGGGSDTSAGVGSGGTGSYSGGPITSFGSIVVNGIHFDQTAAVVTDADNQPRTAAELKLGMVVQLHGSPVTMQAGRQEAAAAVIRALPPKTRDAFLLHRFEALTYRQIAGRLGVSVSMVEKHIAEALRQLKKSRGD